MNCGLGGFDMKRRAVLTIAGAALALAGVSQRAFAVVSACSGNNCAQVSVSPSSVTPSGGVATVGITFKQGANDGQAGGPDEIAALALTLSLSGNASVPLTLNDCTLNADGLPAAVVPDPSISNFKVVVENASCANGRTHCLCPDSGSGITPDNFINLVVYGPNPLPTPGAGTIEIPILPAGPQQLLTIALKVTGSGTIPLHLYNQVSDTQGHPQFTAFLSMGDKNAVDETCVPAAGQPPCSGSATSQVTTLDGSVAGAPACAGDCDASGDVTVNEIIILVNIDLGSADNSACPNGIVPPGDPVDITMIVKAVNNALTNCPAS